MKIIKEGSDPTNGQVLYGICQQCGCTFECFLWETCGTPIGRLIDCPNEKCPNTVTASFATIEEQERHEENCRRECLLQRNRQAYDSVNQTPVSRITAFRRKLTKAICPGFYTQDTP